MSCIDSCRNVAIEICGTEAAIANFDINSICLREMMNWFHTSVLTLDVFVCRTNS